MQRFCLVFGFIYCWCKKRYFCTTCIHHTHKHLRRNTKTFRKNIFYLLFSRHTRKSSLKLEFLLIEFQSSFQFQMEKVFNNMEYILFSLASFILLVENIQTENTNFLNKYEESVNNLVKNGLKGKNL